MNCRLQFGAEWLGFSAPVEVLLARTPGEVLQGLERIASCGLWAVGFVAYEAAGAFDPALKTGAPEGNLPLLCFGLFDAAEKIAALPMAESSGYSLGAWTPSVSRADYLQAVASIKEHIAAGETYQANYTFRLSADFSGDPFALFCDLTAAQPGRHAAFIACDDWAICSASPELFFELNGGRLTVRPMKGTRARALTAMADTAAACALQNSEKDRAENIMIVDMIRNDIGRIAVPGSVETLRCFEIEEYPTVWQMTSTVVGKTAATVAEVFQALFPCASITGAPKVKTMEILQGLETTPRGVYTGALGVVAPDGTAQFNVAIRTAVVQHGRATYGIGGGIVWDSDPQQEYQEALSKAAILTKRMPEFRGLETMRYDPGQGIFLLDRHLERLAASAAYFDFKLDLDAVRRQLCGLRFTEPMRLRLLLDRSGALEVQTFALTPPQSNVVALALAHGPVDSSDPFLYHKTTHRAVYERAKAEFPDADDVLLFNERREITESCFANVVVELKGRRVTPPVSCGLLAGTLRAELLATGEIEEDVVLCDDLQQASAIWLINSVRGKIPALLC
jgi:para-aminobenzoate synthetase/4-amino-4-deoxychorismate lyase